MNGTPPPPSTTVKHDRHRRRRRSLSSSSSSSSVVYSLYVLVDNIRNQWRTPQNTLSFWRHYFPLLFFYPLFIFITRMDR